MTNVILFGAGASSASEDVSPCPPPLGAALFDDMCTHTNLAALIPGDLHATFRDDFEGGLAALYERGGATPPVLREIARYWVGFTAGPNSLYGALIQAVNPRRTIFSTLNYDLLFELAAEHLARNAFYSSEWSPGTVRLLKLHGSINILPDVDPKTFAAAPGEIPKRVRARDRAATIAFLDAAPSLAPTIAPLARARPATKEPDAIAHQQEMWRAVVAAAETIYVIGARIDLRDTLIWEQLGRTPGPLTYFGFDDADHDNFREWQSRFGKANATFQKANFRQAIAAIAVAV